MIRRFSALDVSAARVKLNEPVITVAFPTHTIHQHVCRIVEGEAEDLEYLCACLLAANVGLDLEDD